MKNHKDVALMLALGAAIAAGVFGLGRFSASPSAPKAHLPCHTEQDMSACVADISDHNAAAIGSSAASVSVFCKAQSKGWACATSFAYQGGKVCLISYLVEGKVTGIPVFIKNVQVAPSVCATHSGVLS